MDFNYPTLWIIVLLFLALVGVGIYFSIIYKQKSLPILYPEELSFTVAENVVLQIEIISDYLLIDWGDGDTTIIDKIFTGKIAHDQKVGTTVKVKGNNITKIGFSNNKISKVNFIHCPNLREIDLSENNLGAFEFPNYRITNLNMYNTFIKRGVIDSILSTIRYNGLYSKVKNQYTLNLAGRVNNYPSIPTGYENKQYIIDNLQWSVITN